jgi:hypothetical protein
MFEIPMELDVPAKAPWQEQVIVAAVGAFYFA